MNPIVKGLPTKRCLINPGIRSSVYQNHDRATPHKKLEEVSTKAREGFYTTANIDHLPSIVDKIYHSQWKEDIVKPASNVSTTAN